MSLKNLFFKEDNESEIPAQLRKLAKATNNAAPISVPEVDFNVEGLNTEEVVSVSEIYAKEGLSDLSRSIFKVDEIKGVVPAELPTDAKKKTVLGMLGVSGLDVGSLLTDADSRTAVLKAAKDTLNQTAIESIAADESEIAQLEAQIDALKKGIGDTKKTQEAQNAVIDAEITKINEIVKFIG